MSIFRNDDHEDPWDNGWANEESPSVLASSQYAGTTAGALSGSSYLSPSQLLSSHTPPPLADVGGGSAIDTPSSGSPGGAFSASVIETIPASYKQIYRRIGESCSTTGELESQVFNKLEFESRDPITNIRTPLLTGYQKSKIIDIMYDHNLLPPSRETNFYQILGLIALELELPGSGDFVTLQFRLKDLPAIPPSVVDTLLGNSGLDTSRPDSPLGDDPLNALLANTSISEDDQRQRQQQQRHKSSKHSGNDHSHSPLIDPLLTDHSNIQHHQDSPSKGVSSSHTNTSSTGAGTGGSSGDPISFNEISKYISDIRDTFRPIVGTKDLVRIKEVPEKEGLLFKHTNYIISHEINLGLQSPAGSKKVIRRYSDFVWLLEYLLKKYPFRVIPGLPPKKFTGSAPDSQFLQKRRRGLNRFLNQLVKHPVLVKDSVVVTFLSVPTDLATWKKQAKIDYSLEFKGLKISTHFINSIWPTIGEEFLKDWKQSELNINRLIETWTKCVLLVERYEKRQQQISMDNGKFVEMVNRFSSLNGVVYPHSGGKQGITGGPASSAADGNKGTTSSSGGGGGSSDAGTTSSVIWSSNKDDMSAINDSLASISTYFNKSSQLLIDESFIINTTILEKFKNYLDYLYSLQELFERSKKLSINNIPQLQNRIQENESKYAKLSTDDVDIKGSELAKLRQVIINDKQEIFQQLNKDWLIKECCFKEFIMFQETQYLLSELWIDWSKGRHKFQEKFLVLNETLNREVSGDMPLR